MKAVAEYFRDLSAQDRYFGAEPPVPDAQMLERLAEAEIRRRVEARIAEDGIALKAKAEAPLRTSAFEHVQGVPPTPAPAPSTSAPGESVASRLARLRATAARARAAEPVRPPSIFAEDEAAESPAAQTGEAAPQVAPAAEPPAPPPPAPRAESPEAQIEPEAVETEALSDEPGGPEPVAFEPQPEAARDAPAVEAAEETPEEKAELSLEDASGEAEEAVGPDAATEEPETIAPAQPAETPGIAPEAPQAPASAEAPMLLTRPVVGPAPKGEVENQLRAFMSRLRAANQSVAGAAPQTESEQTESEQTASERPAEPTPSAPAPAEAAPAEAALEPEATRPAEPRDRRRTDKEGASVHEFDRLMETAKSQLEVEGNRRRIAALSHMKAAVAATEADRRLNTDDESGREAAEELDRYRNDLSRLVQGKPGSEGGRRRDDAVATAPARDVPPPLVLASEQRVDQALGRGYAGGAGAAVAGQVAGATSVYLPLESDEEGTDADGESRRTPSMPFADFVDGLNVKGLDDMMEAAAAYLSLQEGREFFSRPQIMRRVALVVAEDAYSREDGLRAFGALLRQGRVVKLRRGQFTIAQSSRFVQHARGTTH